MPGSWTHLASRFFGAIRARDLEPDQRAWLRELLSESEFSVFMEQPMIDRRHGHESASAMSAHTNDHDLLRAAALHDIGKRHARLGVIARALASVCIKLRLPLTARFRAYRDHPGVGGRELAAIGSPAVIVSFATAHHDRRPADIDHITWRMLLDSDNQPERSHSVRSGQ